MKAHHSFAFLIHSLTYTDKDADAQPICLDTPCTAMTVDTLASRVTSARHRDDGLAQRSRQHRRLMIAAS